MTAGAGGHRQGGASAGVVHHSIIEFAGLVDGDAQAVSHRRQAVDTDKASAAGTRLQTGPTARRISRRTDQCQSELQPFNLQTYGIDGATIQSCKSTDVACTQCEQ